MYRRCLITVNSLVRTFKPQFASKNNIHSKYVLRDIRLCKSFSTSNDCSTENWKKVNFEELKNLTSDKNVLIIDVREPDELIEDGVIPGSINIPLGEVEETLKNTPDDQFFKKYGRYKPDEKTPIIFSCKKGIRSEKAQIVALQLGYKDVKNYSGGWVDWAENIKRCK